MDSGLQRLQHERRVVGIRRGEVDGVDVPGFQQRVESVVIGRVFDAVFFRQFTRLVLVAGDEGGHHGIAGVFDAGHEVLLGDPARAHHGVADFAAIGTISKGMQ